MAKVSFRQGIVTHQEDAYGNQTFLYNNNGYVSLQANDEPTVITLADEHKDYLYTERQSVPNAWGPFQVNAGIDYYLYWDIDTLTAERTFGATTVEPIQSNVQPTGSIATGTMWWNPSKYQWYEYNGTRWVSKLRVFAALLTNGVVLSSLSINAPEYHGTQLGLEYDVEAGAVLFDLDGLPYKDTKGKFFTTVDKFRSGLGSSSSATIEVNQFQAIAGSNIGEYSIVEFSDYNEIVSAVPHRGISKVYGIIETDASTGELVTVRTEGVVFNEHWDWSAVGANANDPLYIGGTGNLSRYQQHPSQEPVAVIISKQKILFRPGSFNGGAYGVYSHSDLKDLTDDDHPQYLTDQRGDANYYRKAEVDTIADGKSDVGHVHVKADITDFEHVHTISDVINLQTELDSKSDIGHVHEKVDIIDFEHTHEIADVVNLSTELSNRVRKNVSTTMDTNVHITFSGGEVLGLPSVPSGATSATSKAYVDSLIQGISWNKPVITPNLIAVGATVPPSTVTNGESYVVGSIVQGDWLLAGAVPGSVVTYNNGWVVGPVVEAGDVFLVSDDAVQYNTENPSNPLIDEPNMILAITNATPSSLAYTTSEPSGGSAVYVGDEHSQFFGHSYTYNDEDEAWVEFQGPGRYVGGNNIEIVNGNYINVIGGTGSGLNADLWNDQPATFTSPSGKQVISYNTTTSEWINYSLLPSDIGAALAVHSHSYADITDILDYFDPSTIKSIGDVNSGMVPSNGQVLSYNGLTSMWESRTPITTFSGLTDTPAGYSGAANAFVRVNSAGTGLQFVPNPGYLTSVNWGDITGILSNQTDLQTVLDLKVNTSEKGAINGIATLDSDGKIPSSQIPAIAITDTFVVASENAMTSSGAQTGDIAIRTDISKTFILTTLPANVIGNWRELATPASAVTSVNGKVGTVTLTTTDVSEGSNLYFTDSRVTSNATVQANTAARHTHANLAILDATTSPFTIALANKLANIEDNATGDLTANEILTLIKTVDGAGSGLDADTLDGLSSAAFEPAFTKNTAFNKNFGGTGVATTVARSDHNHDASYIGIAQKGAANGVATLGPDSKIPSSQLPAIAITDTFVVSSQSAMLATTAQTGDIAIRTDTNTTYILQGTNPAILSNWQQLRSPSTGTTSVNGQTGTVILTTSDIPEDSNLYYTEQRVTDNATVQANTTKLAGIEAGATADQTPTEIMAAVQTLDGHGSGLDADTVDGIHGASIVRNDVTNQTIDGINLTIRADDLDVAEFAAIGTSIGSGRIFVGSTALDGGGIAYTDSGHASVPSDDTAVGLYRREAGTNFSVMEYLNTSSDVTFKANVTTEGYITSADEVRIQPSLAATQAKLNLYDFNETVQAALIYDPSSDSVIIRRYAPDSVTTEGELELTSSVFTYNGNEVLTTASTIDADTFGGVAFGEFARLNVPNTFTNNITISNGDPSLIVNDTDAVDGQGRVRMNGEAIQIEASADTGTNGVMFSGYGGANLSMFQVRTGGTWHDIWHAGNDGTGSGLDADTLDGVEGSNYARTDVTETFTNGLTFTRAISVSGTDLNNLIEAGFYDGQLLTNAPLGSADWWYINVYRHTNNNGYVMQEATSLSSSPPKKYFRTQDNTIWGAWIEILDGNSVVGGTDADTLDGFDSTAFGRLAIANTWVGAQEFNGGIDVAGGVTSGITLEDGNHVITTNDGGGNFNIRVGNNRATGTDLITEDGYASHWVYSQTNGLWTFKGTTASQLVGQTATFQNLLTLDASGNLTATGDVTAFSDIRVKTNITAIENATDKVNALSGYTFDRTDIEARQAGVIAQEVQSVLPEAVKVNEDIDRLSVSTSGLVGLLIQAFNEQTAVINDLKSRIEELEKQ